MIKNRISLAILMFIPIIGISQASFVLPDNKDKLNLQELYRDQKIKEVKISRKTINQFDTSTSVIRHQFFDENGNMLEEKDLETKQTILNFLDQNEDLFRKIFFLDAKKTNTTYYYFNRYDRLIATEIYDRLDSLSITNYYNYFDSGNEIKCIITNSQGDTTQFEYLLFQDPEKIVYQRFKYPDILACEISYVMNDQDQISRKIHNDILKETFESWGYAYDENNRRYIGEKYNENQELTGTVEYFHDAAGLMKWETYRDRGARVEYELIYEYQRY